MYCSLIASYAINLCRPESIGVRGAGRGKGIQYFPRGTIRDTVFPKNILHGGAKYPRISCIGVPKRGDVIITVTGGCPGQKWRSQNIFDM